MMFLSMTLLGRLFLLLELFTRGSALASIYVKPVRTTPDVLALADLRFDEWIANDNTQQKQPSRASFRAATMEIHEERFVEGAIAFIARLIDDNTVVGAAELSPIELKDAILDSDNTKILYVTDVVTSRQHRRMGVASKLMHALEEEAASQGVSKLLLHVKPSNTAALQFYCSHNLGYCEITANDMTALLDVQKLASNAGAEGQILLSKNVLITTKLL